jgi:hypothetical protein
MSKSADKHEKVSKEGPNTPTIKAGLHFNVNTVRNALKDYYKNQVGSPPMFAGGHIAITTVIEKVYELILRETVANVGKDKSGMKVINHDILLLTIKTNDDLKNYYLNKIGYYQKDTVYKNSIPIIPSEMEKVADKVDNNLDIRDQATNLMYFLVLTVFNDVASACYQFLAFAKKKSVDFTCVTFAVKNRFPDGIAAILCNELAKVAKAVDKDDLSAGAGDGEQDDETKEDTAGDEDSDEEPQVEEPKKKAEKPKTTKSSNDSSKKKSSKTIETSDNEDTGGSDHEDTKDANVSDDDNKKTKKKSQPKKKTPRNTAKK